MSETIVSDGQRTRTHDDYASTLMSTLEAELRRTDFSRFANSRKSCCDTSRALRLGSSLIRGHAYRLAQSNTQ